MMEVILSINIVKLDKVELEKYREKLNCFVVSSSAAWLDDTKINNHYGIWKRVFKTTDKGIFGRFKDQVGIRQEQKVKFLGLAEIKTEGIDKAINSLSGEFDNCLFLSDKTFDELFSLFTENYREVLSDVDFFNVEEKYIALSKLLGPNSIILRPPISDETDDCSMVEFN